MIFDYTFDSSIIAENKKSDFKKAIKILHKSTSRLTKHTKFQDKPSKLEVVLELFDADFDNIGFVCKNSKKINSIIEKYSDLEYRFPHFELHNIKNEIKEIRIKAEFDEKNQTFIIDKSALTPMEIFSLICIQERELLYICMHIYNKWEKRSNERLWYPLKHTFSILSSRRDFVEWKYLNEHQDFDNYVFMENDNVNPNLE